MLGTNVVPGGSGMKYKKCHGKYLEWSVLCSDPLGRMIVLRRGVETPQTEFRGLPP
jgi:hypothetical protein